MKGVVEITPELVRRCDKLAKRWMRKNKHVVHEDTWDSFLDHDINLYVEDNQITVTAYPLTIDPFGDIVPITDKGVAIIVHYWKYPR